MCGGMKIDKKGNVECKVYTVEFAISIDKDGNEEEVKRFWYYMNRLVDGDKEEDKGKGIEFGNSSVLYFKVLGSRKDEHNILNSEWSKRYAKWGND